MGDIGSAAKSRRTSIKEHKVDVDAVESLCSPKLSGGFAACRTSKVHDRQF